MGPRHHPRLEIKKIFPSSSSKSLGVDDTSNSTRPLGVLSSDTFRHPKNI